MSTRNYANGEGGVRNTNNPVESRIIRFNDKDFYQIKRYEGYFISKDGEILTTVVIGSNPRRYDFSKPRLKAIRENVAGYKTVDFREKNGNGKWELIHRLLYETFVGDIPNNMVIDHIDSNRCNNTLDNLRLLSQKDNVCRKLNSMPHKNGTAFKIKAVIDNKNVETESINEFCAKTGIKKYIFNSLRAKSQYGKIIPCNYKKYTLLSYSESIETIEIELKINLRE